MYPRFGTAKTDMESEKRKKNYQLILDQACSDVFVPSYERERIKTVKIVPQVFTGLFTEKRTLYCLLMLNIHNSVMVVIIILHIKSSRWRNCSPTLTEK